MGWAKPWTSAVAPGEHTDGRAVVDSTTLMAHRFRVSKAFVVEWDGRLLTYCDVGGREPRAKRSVVVRLPQATEEERGATGTLTASRATKEDEVMIEAVAHDVLIVGGRVVDGTGNPWFYGDVAMTGDRISAVAPAGSINPTAAREVVDAQGIVVCPGFVDIQSHSIVPFLTDRSSLSKVT